MKKKIINGLLMFALLVSSMNAIVSCKDIDEGAYEQMQWQINNNQLTLIEMLKKQYTELDAAIKNLNECECATKGYITQAQADLRYLQITDAANTYLTKNDAAKYYLTIAQWKTDSIMIRTLIAKLEGRMDSTKKVLEFHDSVLASHDSIIVLHDSAIAAHKVLLDTLANQVAKNSLSIKDLNSKVSVIDSLAKDNKKRLDNLTTTVGNLTTTVNKLDSLANLWIVDIKNLQTKVSHLDTLVINMGLRLDTVSQKAIDAYNKAVAVETYAKTTRNSLDSLCEVVANIVIPELSGYYTKDQIDSIMNGIDLSNFATKDDVKKLDSILKSLNIPDISSLVTKHYVDSIIDALNIPDISNLATKDELKKVKDDAAAAVAAVETIANQAVSDAANAQTTADNAQSLATTVQTTVGELTNTVTTFIEKTYVEKITEVDKDLNEINEKLNKLTQDLRSLITGIILQGTYNPVVGYGNAPIDVRSLILAAYHGYADVAFEFPERQAGNYLNENDINYWNARTKAVLGVSNIKQLEGWQKYEAGVIMDEVDGNAGKVYLTVNPTSIDFDDTKLKGLFTSTGRKSAITLSNIKPSKHELTFGYTRGGEGFYEADATLKKADIGKTGMNIEFRNLANEIKDAVKTRNKSSIVNLAFDILRNASDIMPAYGVKASWTDSEGKAHDIVSQYGIAATSVKPLSYSFLKDKEFKRIPGIGRFQTYVNRLMNKATKKIKDMFPIINAPTFTFTSIDIKDFDDDGDGIVTVHVSGHVKDATGTGHASGTTDPELIDGEWYTFNFDVDVDCNVEGDIDGSADVTSMLQELIDEINTRYGEGSPVDVAMADLVNAVNEFNKMSENVQATSDDIKSKINNYITKVNNKLLLWLNNAHKALYITMLAEQGNKMAMLSQSVELPTKCKAGAVTLLPTSYSVELFAPAYKKFVGISNVYNAADKSELSESEAIAAAQTAKGENMGKVIGRDEQVTINGKAGYIYEILYTAVDYHGVSTIKKFYIQF